MQLIIPAFRRIDINYIHNNYDAFRRIDTTYTLISKQNGTYSCMQPCVISIHLYNYNYCPEYRGINNSRSLVNFRAISLFDRPFSYLLGHSVLAKGHSYDAMRTKIMIS